MWIIINGKLNCTWELTVALILMLDLHKDLTSSLRYFPVGIKISQKQTVYKSWLSKSWFTCSGEIKRKKQLQFLIYKNNLSHKPLVL